MFHSGHLLTGSRAFHDLSDSGDGGVSNSGAFAKVTVFRGTVAYHRQRSY